MPEYEHGPYANEEVRTFEFEAFFQGKDAAKAFINGVASQLEKFYQDVDLDQLAHRLTEQAQLRLQLQMLQQQQMQQQLLEFQQAQQQQVPQNLFGSTNRGKQRPFQG